jgi:hypothetical protein
MTRPVFRDLRSTSIFDWIVSAADRPRWNLIRTRLLAESTKTVAAQNMRSLESRPHDFHVRPGSEMTMWSIDTRSPGVKLPLDMFASLSGCAVVVETFVGVRFCLPNWQVPHNGGSTFGLPRARPFVPSHPSLPRCRISLKPQWIIQ